MKISEELAERMAELGMEFVKEPHPPTAIPEVVWEEDLIEPRKIYPITVPQLEKDLSVFLVPDASMCLNRNPFIPFEEIRITKEGFGYAHPSIISDLARAENEIDFLERLARLRMTFI